jgi:hypothetical protein
MITLFNALINTGHTATVLTSSETGLKYTLIRFDRVPDVFPTTHAKCLWFVVNDTAAIFAVAPTKSKALAIMVEDFGQTLVEAE